MFEINLEDLNSIFAIKPEDITKSFLYHYFTVPFGKSSPLVDNEHELILNLDILKKYNSCLLEYSNIQELIGKTATIGQIIANIRLTFIPFEFTENDDKGMILKQHKGNLANLINFVNEPMTKKVLGKLDQSIATVFLDGEVNNVVMNTYINNSQWLGYTTAPFSNPSLDVKTIDPSDTIINYRNKKLAENKEAIENKDALTFGQVEKDILNFAAEQLDKEGATGKMIYDSGFNGDFSNNYKVTSIMRGVSPKSDDLNNFEIATSSLNEGVKKEDIPAHADLAVLGGAGRAKDTALAGYKTKMFNAAFGSVTAGLKGTDCRTKGYEEIFLTDNNAHDYRFRNIIVDGKLINLDRNTMKKYLNRKVMMRSPLHCNSKKICNICMGDLTYKLKIRNIGLHVARITTKLMNFSMKSFHSMTVSGTDYDLTEYIESE
jgi:hypothetical protein